MGDSSDDCSLTEHSGLQACDDFWTKPVPTRVAPQCTAAEPTRRHRTTGSRPLRVRLAQSSLPFPTGSGPSTCSENRKSLMNFHERFPNVIDFVSSGTPRHGNV